MKQTVLVTGATGFIGSHLAQRLEQAGLNVRAMTRHPERYTGAGEPVAGDVGDRPSLARALKDVDAAYYLVHSLSHDDFEARDAQAARNFAQAAGEADLEQIIYLGGLGVDNQKLSAHLRSRREVETILATGSVPVTTLRAAVIIGAGGISWEITRQLVDHLPAMILPAWADTLTQPIALNDALDYLTGVLNNSLALGRVFEIGGPEALSYADMLHRVARLQGRDLPAVTTSLLTTQLTSLFLPLVTDVDTAIARTLVDSLSNEVVVHDHSIQQVVPGQTMTFDDAARDALANHEADR